MSDPHTVVRNKARGSNLSLNFDIYEDQQDPQPATKRLFSNRGVKSEAGPNEENNGAYAAGDEHHSGKRSRISEWPLTTRADRDHGQRHKSPLRDQSLANSPGRGTRASSLTRPSKFLEGSMNDRVSCKPPSVYIGTDEEIRERYEMEQNISVAFQRRSQLGKRATYQVEGKQPPSDKSGSNRSSIFRFGKSLAASFNPNNWKLWIKTGELESAAERQLRERKENAESIYQDLKQKGQLKNFRHGPFDQLRQFDDKKPGFGKNESCIQGGSRYSDAGRPFGELKLGGNTPKHEKRYAIYVPDSPSRLLLSNCETTPVHTESQALDIQGSEARSSTRRSSFHFKKPSISNLRLGSSTKLPLVAGDSSEAGNHSLRHLPSRKDLQKQQKLVKRVSNLEEKLEAARRQLLEAMGEPLPNQLTQESRPRFVPGTLATLPSERFLSSHLPLDAISGEQDNPGEIGQAVTTDKNLTSVSSGTSDPQASEASHSHSAAFTETPLPQTRAALPDHDQSLELKMIEKSPSELLPMAQTAFESSESTSKPMRRPSKKRKSVGLGETDDSGKYHPDGADEEASEISEPVVKRGRGRPKKLRKVEQEKFPTISKRRSSSTIRKKLQSPAKNGRLSSKGRQSVSPRTSSDLAGRVSVSDERKSLEGGDENTGFSMGTSGQIPPIPSLPEVFRQANYEAIDIKTVRSMKSSDLDAINERGLPYCTACSQEFSSRNRLVAHVSKFCKAIKMNEGAASGRNAKSRDDESDVRGKKSFEWPADVF